jgi:iron-sulfur cluster repair protein YtfE (RIC family)
MKRHAALQPLSRDHHVALVAAQRLRRATEATADDARQHFLTFWHEHGAKHFRVEEDVLLPRFAAHADPDTAAIARMLMDHVRIRARALAVATAGVDELHALGEELAEHVRLEERRVFPLIEASLSDAAAAELVAAVQRAEHE